MWTGHVVRGGQQAWYLSEPVAVNGQGAWQNVQVPMRQDCKHFESRTYRNGETVRKCDLDLAPEAPWRCPADCPRYERRMADVNWAHGTLVTPQTPDEPMDALDRDDGSVARLLDEAEEIVNMAGPDIMAEVHAERERGMASRWRRWRRRKD